MSNKRNKLPEVRTPALLVDWANLVKPADNFNKDGKEFKVTLKGTPAELKAFQKEVETLAKAAQQQLAAETDKPATRKKILAAKLHANVKPVLDKDTGEETGDYAVTFKCPEFRKPKNPGDEPVRNSVKIFDAKLNEVRKECGRGSKLRALGVALPFYNASAESVGVTLRLSAVQILQHVPIGGGVTAESSGFAKEDGYEGTEGNDAPFEATGDDTDAPPTKPAPSAAAGRDEF